jgi:hypothetical protein
LLCLFPQHVLGCEINLLFYPVSYYLTHRDMAELGMWKPRTLGLGYKTPVARSPYSHTSHSQLFCSIGQVVYTRFTNILTKTICYTVYCVIELNVYKNEFFSFSFTKIILIILNFLYYFHMKFGNSLSVLYTHTHIHHTSGSLKLL